MFSVYCIYYVVSILLLMQKLSESPATSRALVRVRRDCAQQIRAAACVHISRWLAVVAAPGDGAVTICRLSTEVTRTTQQRGSGAGR